MPARIRAALDNHHADNGSTRHGVISREIQKNWKSFLTFAGHYHLLTQNFEEFVRHYGMNFEAI
ncbi:MAG: hypothetical protein IIC60_11285 [Proteobacteria bacterium]|nr:hypothetical protein [Pseudomonadota bacterium]